MRTMLLVICVLTLAACGVEPIHVVEGSCFLYAEGNERCVVGDETDSVPWACTVGYNVPEGAEIHAYLCETGAECEEISPEAIRVDDHTLSAPCSSPVDELGNGQWVRFEIY